MFAKIIDDKTIVRDCKSNAILAVDRAALERSRAKRNADEKKQKEIADLKDQVAKLTTIVEQLMQQVNK